MNKNYMFFMALALLESKKFWGDFGVTGNNQLESTREFLGKKKRRKKR